MAIGLVGRKRGMTRVFTEDGASVPVTVIEALPNRVTRVKCADSDGYSAVRSPPDRSSQAGSTSPWPGSMPRSARSRARACGSSASTPRRLAPTRPGSEITVEAFTAGQLVDVRGTTIGKGYAGTIKRHNFQSQDATHGNSVSHRAPGSIGQRQTPGRVFKGKRMSGHMGNVGRSILNLAVVRVDKERNLLLIKGAVPGHAGSHVVVKPAAKVRRKKKG